MHLLCERKSSMVRSRNQTAWVQILVIAPMSYEALGRPLPSEPNFHLCRMGLIAAPNPRVVVSMK